MCLILDELFGDKQAEDWLNNIPKNELVDWYQKIRERAVEKWYLYDEGLCCVIQTRNQTS
ncbi:hypothetical protein P7M35_24615, partial [Vibrio parahaemolyticus]|nr:hypothetical protein [Vibrio parahaemolyticus]